MKLNIKQGEIYMVNSTSLGHRPVLIISNNRINKFWTKVNVIKITSANVRNKRLPTHFPLDSTGMRIYGNMFIQVEEIHTVEKRDLGEKIGQISDKQLAEIIFLRKIVLDSPDRYEIEKIGEKIETFERLLNEHEDDNESVFHEFLYENSFLLDLYGKPVSKPRFKYPTIIESPLRKAYVEPDFIIKYPNQQYKLVELEKPSKKVTTKRGYSSSEFTQPAFQIAEWNVFIAEHYEQIKADFPGINVNKKTMLVISRNRLKNFYGYSDIVEAKKILTAGYNIDEIWYYVKKMDTLNREK